MTVVEFLEVPLRFLPPLSRALKAGRDDMEMSCRSPDAPTSGTARIFIPFSRNKKGARNGAPRGEYTTEHLDVLPMAIRQDTLKMNI